MAVSTSLGDRGQLYLGFTCRARREDICRRLHAPPENPRVMPQPRKSAILIPPCKVNSGVERSSEQIVSAIFATIRSAKLNVGVSRGNNHITLDHRALQSPRQGIRRIAWPRDQARYGRRRRDPPSRTARLATPLLLRRRRYDRCPEPRQGIPAPGRLDLRRRVGALNPDAAGCSMTL